MEEKNKVNENIVINRYKIFHEQNNKIILYDKLFLYQCDLTQEENKDIIEIKNIEFINTSKSNIENSNNKNIFKINNIIIFFNNDEEGSLICKELEEKFKQLKENNKNKLDKYSLKSLLNYVEKL